EPVLIRKPSAPPKVEAEPVPTESRTITVHDVDITFQGQTYPLTLRENDSITEEEDRLLVQYADGRSITIYKAHLWFIAERDRTITENVPITLQKHSGTDSLQHKQ